MQIISAGLVLTMKLTIFSLLVCLVLVAGVCYSSPAPPVLISGIVLDYNVAGIDATIKNSRTGFSVMVETNSNGEIHYEANPSDWNCNDQIQITILSKTESGYMDCDNYGGLLGYVDHNTGLVFAQFDFSALECKKLYPYKECEECILCEECIPCEPLPCIPTPCIPPTPCEKCPICPITESGIIMQILGIIFGIVAGAGISLCVYKDKDGKLKFTVRMHRHQGRNYLHPVYRVHRAPYKHEYCEIMPVYKWNGTNWFYVPQGD